MYKNWKDVDDIKAVYKHYIYIHYHSITRRSIAEMLLKVALNTIILTLRSIYVVLLCYVLL
jgi:hypothetical protein